MPTFQDSTSASPDTPVDKLREIVANVIDVVATQGGKAIDTLGLRTPSKYWSPDVDVDETEEQVIVAVDLPGVDPNKVEILLAGNMLTIRGERPASEAASGKGAHRRERSWGPFSRSIPLPVAVNPELVAAESQQGVLVIRVAKEDRMKARHIPITVRDPQA